MKLHSFIFISLFSLIFITPAFAQKKAEKKTVEAKFWAAGVCGMCQNRIETALDVPGVQFATWAKDSQVVTVIYRQDKVSLDELKEKVARAGHQTKDISEDSKAYSDLPKCCQYKDGAKKH